MGLISANIARGREHFVISRTLTTLRTTIDSGQSLVHLAASVSFGDDTAEGTYLEIDNELMLIDDVVNGTTIRVSRGQQGTSAASHTNGTNVIWKNLPKVVDGLITGLENGEITYITNQGQTLTDEISENEVLSSAGLLLLVHEILPPTSINAVKLTYL